MSLDTDVDTTAQLDESKDSRPGSEIEFAAKEQSEQRIDIEERIAGPYRRRCHRIDVAALSGRLVGFDLAERGPAGGRSCREQYEGCAVTLVDRCIASGITDASDFRCGCRREEVVGEWFVVL